MRIKRKEPQFDYTKKSYSTTCVQNGPSDTFPAAAMSDFIFPITPTSAKQEQLLVHDQQHQQQHFLNTGTWNLPSSSALSTSPTSSASKMEQAYHQITASSPPSVCLDAKSALSFPLKLRHMLEEAEDLGLSHIVSWEMEGTAFRVHNPDEFVHLIMRRWFNQTKYKSFQRVSQESVPRVGTFSIVQVQSSFSLKHTAAHQKPIWICFFGPTKYPH